MKRVKYVIAAVIVVAIAAVEIWYYASGHARQDQNAKNASATQTAEDQIKSNWTKFFAGSTAAQGKINLLQNGQQFAQVIEAQAQTATAKATTASVSSVSLNNNNATVTYTIDIAGQPALSNQKGQAIQLNGTWKVGDAAFCGLLQLSGMAPPNCQ